VIKKSNTKGGMKAGSKLKWQILASLTVSISVLYLCQLSTDFFVPFMKYPLFDMGVLAILFWTLVIVSSSNAVNLTDGLDGLATVPSIYAFISLSGLAYVMGNAVLSSYLLLPKISGAGELTVVGASLIGSLIGFLWYNSNPAQVFMGDSGSLTLGALMGYFAIVTKSEILLLFIGFIFVLETLSVIIQVGSYKTRGKRVFLMAPLHHHFELLKWHENKIIVRFWIVALLSNIIAIISIKIR
jgi:phospho-N-acetylmuramoyl-pentapeptide-transferase